MSTPAREQRGSLAVRFLIVLALLYIFLVGVKMLETGIKTLGSDFTDQLFEGVANPVAGLLVGILATVLVQSSSVTTATIVGLVGSGTLSVEAAVPMVMGANIGTTVTNTIVALGHARRTDEFRRAFAAATMHDFFNVLAVAVLLPLELLTGFLSRTATVIAQFLTGRVDLGAAPGSPIQTAVKAPVGAVESLLDGLGLASGVTGSLLMIGGIALVFFSLAFITRNMRKLLAGRIERSLNTVLSRGGGLAAMLVGVVITVSVQSSSITTSILIPMVASGVLTLVNAYPITLGANMGTTVTALLASLAAASSGALVVALTHTLFNAAGILLFYPMPRLRMIPIALARQLARTAVTRPTLAVVYVVGTFLVVPLVGILILR